MSVYMGFLVPMSASSDYDHHFNMMRVAVWR